MEVACTWGDGPDIVLSLKGDTMILLEDPIDKDKWTNGTVSKGQMDLTAEEAESLAGRLMMASLRVKELREFEIQDLCDDIRYPMDEFGDEKKD